jgi:hypothetical protein
LAAALAGVEVGSLDADAALDYALAAARLSSWAAAAEGSGWPGSSTPTRRSNRRWARMCTAWIPTGWWSRGGAASAPLPAAPSHAQ